MKVLAERVGVPEVIPYFDRCGASILREVEDLLHSLIAVQGHPSPAYRARARVGFLNNIWDLVHEFDQAAHLKWLILDRIEWGVRARGLHDFSPELRALANLWDMSEAKEDLDAECAALEDLDWRYLEQPYLYSAPSLAAVEHTAGRAIYYAANGDMSGTVPAHEAVEYFGWEI